MEGIISLLTTTDGRINRQRWWIGLLVIIGISIAVAIVLSIISFGNPTIVVWGGFLLSIVMLWPTYCIGVKRRHDRDNDGKDLIALIAVSMLLNLLQVLGIGMTVSEVGGVAVLVPDMWLMVLQIAVFIFAIYMLVQVGFLKGTDGPNQYGPDPLGTQ
jgi:uncharacterized membrane protein YhaH (DUF805 family)